MTEIDSDYNKVKDLLDCYDPYHIHKENMAYSGMLLLVGIFSWIMTTENWPLRWTLQYSKWIVGSGIFVIWMLIHSFIGWQLANKRTASKIINAAMRYLWGNDFPLDNTMVKSNCDGFANSKISKIALMLWWPCTKILPDVDFHKSNKLPKIFISNLTMDKTCHGEEGILFWGSLIMLGLIIIRTIWP